ALLPSSTTNNALNTSRLKATTIKAIKFFIA
ncbi:MAG: hypothetical protein ACI9DO_003396, partial [Reinekea sp.]